MAHLEQSVVRSIQSPQEVIVNCHAADAAVIGQHSGLRLDQLRRQDAAHGAEQRVAAHQIQVSTQLFDALFAVAASGRCRDPMAARRRFLRQIMKSRENLWAHWPSKVR